MREGWTYKKWADVLTIINGKNQTAVESKDGEYPIYGSGGIMGYANNWLCPENCVVIGRKGNINKPIFVTTKFWNVDTAFGLNAHDNSLLPKFLFYFCQDYNFERHNKAVTIPSLTKADLLKINIPIPSLSEQQAIVSELDKINELISLKKAQLSDLDSLAQSIFNDMFGDPIENEKGWEVKKLGEVCDVRDGTHDSPQYLSESEYFLITSKNIQGDIIDYANVNYISKEDYDSINKRSYVDEGDIIMGMIGTIGKPIIVHKNNLKFCVKNVALIKFPESCLVKNIYVKALLDNDSYKQYLLSLNKGGTQKFVALGTLRTLKCPLPPLSLQQDFAKRIELIEKQKAQISSTIKDLETLLASRMQYWFD